MAANMALTFGTAFGMEVGFSYLWVFPAEKLHHRQSLHDAVFLPVRCHQRRRGFRILIQRQECTLNMKKVMEKPAKSGYPYMDATDYYHDRALSILQWALKEGAEG